MRNDVCFPCLEHPNRCFLLSVPPEDDPNPFQLRQALSCNRKGEIGASGNRKSWEEWFLMAEDADAGIYKIVNAAHNLVLVCDSDGNLSAKKAEIESLETDTGCWSLEDEDDHIDQAMYRIRSFAGNCYLACTSDSEGGGTISTVSDPTPATLWKLEYLTGELCYINLLGQSTKLLLCDNLGNLRMSQVWGGWEIWRFIEAGHNQVRISSWTHQHKLLSCDAYGNVSTTEDRWSPGTLWTVQRAPKGLDGVLIISGATGRLLRCAHNYTTGAMSLTSSGYIDGLNTTWQLSAAHRDKYYLSSIGYDLRVSLIKDTQLKTTTLRRDCEVWCVVKLANGFVNLQSEKFGRLLRYDGQGLSVSEKESGEGDITAKWRIVESPTGQGVSIVSAREPFLALSCNSKGELEAVDHQGPFESWKLEPFMPDSLEGWQINLMIGGAVGAALLGPAIAAGVLGCGAAAAAAEAGVVTMAAETTTAVAASEAAAAATMAGLSFAGATAAMGAGAAVGLSTTGIVVATSKRDRGEGTDLRQADQDRPFCEWRSW